MFVTAVAAVDVSSSAEVAVHNNLQALQLCAQRIDQSRSSFACAAEILLRGLFLQYVPAVYYYITSQTRVNRVSLYIYNPSNVVKNYTSACICCMRACSKPRPITYACGGV